jgi:hypothetical protein
LSGVVAHDHRIGSSNGINDHRDKISALKLTLDLDADGLVSDPDHSGVFQRHTRREPHVLNEPVRAET